MKILTNKAKEWPWRTDVIGVFLTKDEPTFIPDARIQEIDFEAKTSTLWGYLPSSRLLCEIEDGDNIDITIDYPSAVGHYWESDVGFRLRDCKVLDSKAGPYSMCQDPEALWITVKLGCQIEVVER